jgi:hypothetical protein
VFSFLFSAVGNWWVDLRLESLQEMARAAEQRAQKAVHEATESERLARTEQPLERAMRSPDNLRLSMAKVYESSPYRLAQKANRKYFAVIEALCFMLSWRAPICTAPQAKVALRRFVQGVERALVAREYALKAQLRLLANYQAMLERWSALDLSVSIASTPDLSKAQKYRGVTYYHETALSTAMCDSAVRADIYARKIAVLIESIKAEEARPQPTGVRPCLVAVERELNSRSAYAAREVRYWFHSIQALQMRFCNLERTGKLLPQNEADVLKARAMLAGASERACLGLREAYDTELASLERMKQLLAGARGGLS